MIDFDAYDDIPVEVRLDRGLVICFTCWDGGLSWGEWVGSTASGLHSCGATCCRRALGHPPIIAQPHPTTSRMPHPLTLTAGVWPGRAGGHQVL